MNPNNNNHMSYSLLSENHPKARKEHQCIWCGQMILKGEKYRRETSIYDGNFQNHKWHLECDAAAKVEFRNGEDEFDPCQNERPDKKIVMLPTAT